MNLLNEYYNNSFKDIENETYSKMPFIGVTADAGTGKSRLVHEFLSGNSSIQSDTHYSIAYATNISSKPYYIFLTLIKDIFKISEMDSLSMTKEKFENGIEALKKYYNKKLLDSAIPFVGFLLGINYKDDRLKDRNEFKNHLHISIKSIFEAVCLEANSKNKPYLFILDDLHWIDKMSMEMLEYILNTINISSDRNNTTPSYPIILSTYRKEFVFPEILKNKTTFNEISLRPLSRDYSRELIDKLLINIEVEQDKKNELLEKSKGNPFFIEEWVSLLKETHSYTEPLDESRGVHNVYKIPNSLNSLILARIDALEKSLKSLLQKATIIGEEFFVQILSKLEHKLGLADEIQTPINNLEKENFIKHFINQLDHYKFKHILTRDVAYSTILKSNKKVLHSAVAEIIEENFSDKLDVFYFDLAIHYDISENHEKAIKFLSLAGLKHIFVSDFVHAKQCYDRILSILESNQPYKDIVENLDKNQEPNKEIINTYINAKACLGKIYINTGKWDDAFKVLSDISNKMNLVNFETQFEVSFNLGKILALKNSHDESRSYFQKSIEISKNDNNKYNEALCLGEIAHLDFDIGNKDDALAGFKKELEFATTLKNERLLGIASLHLGMYYFQNGDLDTSLRFYKKLYQIASKLDQRQQILQSLGNISLIHNIRGEYDQSLEHFKEVIAISEDIHDLRNQAMTYGNQGIIFKNIKDYNKSLENYNKQLNISKEIGDKWMISNSYSGIGLVHQKTGDFDESIKNTKMSLDIKDSINDKNGHSNDLINIASTYLRMGDFDKAKNNLTTAYKALEELKNDRSIHLVNLELGKVYFYEENYKDSIESLNKSLSYFKEINDIAHYSESLILLSQVYRISGSKEDSKKLLNDHSVDTSSHKIESKVEKLILNLNDKDSETKEIIKLAEGENVPTDLKAYIYFNVGVITDNSKHISKSKSLYESLYKKTKDFKYTYYLNQIK